MISKNVNYPIKVCTICKYSYPHTSKYFYPAKQNKSGLEGRCKVCYKMYEAKKKNDRNNPIYSARKRKLKNSAWKAMVKNLANINFEEFYNIADICEKDFQNFIGAHIHALDLDIKAEYYLDKNLKCRADLFIPKIELAIEVKLTKNLSRHECPIKQKERYKRAMEKEAMFKGSWVELVSLDGSVGLTFEELIIIIKEKING